LHAQAAFWDEQAASFDQAPDHGLHDPRMRAAWTALLVSLLPAGPCRIVDLGCGTGTLALLLASQGHAVTGIDLSPKMIELARHKAQAAAVGVDLRVGDASAPALERREFDVVLARHVLWTLPDPDVAIGRWLDLLNARGRLLLIEGRWGTGAGLTATEALQLVRAHGHEAEAIPIPSEAYWGAKITDERYVVVSPPGSLRMRAISGLWAKKSPG
jgi:SAM-dependent methyltransferase